MLRYTVLLSLAAAVYGYHEIKHRDCKSIFPVSSVQIHGAHQVEEEDGRHVTVLRSGTLPKLRILFKPDVAASDFKTTVNAKLDGALLKWNMPEPDSCKFMTCPTVPGEETVFEQSIDIKEEYPKNKRIQVNWVLDGNHDDKRHDVCVIFLARIEE